MPGFLDELKWRGLFHQATDEAGLAQWLSDPTGNPRRAYVGFDPTADSLTIGNLVPMMMLVHFQRHGHQPVVVMGGGTGLIGDPSGKSAERQLMTAEQVASNVERQRAIFANVWRGADLKAAPTIVNNLDWLGKLGFLEVLRDVGKHFSVNMMIQKDSVRERLHARDQGISYTEFSYMVLQAFDFEYLFEHENVSVQMGGSDQWGNIVAGIDLIRSKGISVLADSSFALHAADQAREAGDEQASAEFEAQAKELWELYRSAGGWTPPAIVESSSAKVDDRFRSSIPPRVLKQLESMKGFYASARAGWEGFGVTAPLVTKSDGGKFGKTEAGAIWLSPPNPTGGTGVGTSAYAYYQFWLNAADGDAIRYLKIFTLLPRERIDELEESQKKDPAAREAQRVLAREATTLLHGKGEADHAESAAKALFTGDLAGLPAALLDEVLGAVPSSQHDKGLLAGEGVPLLDLLPQTTLAKSKSEARELLSSGSITVNGQKPREGNRLTSADLLHGRLIALRRGKKTWHVTRWA